MLLKGTTQPRMDVSPEINSQLNESNALQGQLTKKWAPLLKKNFSDVPQKNWRNVAILLENQNKYIQKKFGRKGATLLAEDLTTTGDIADFTRFSLQVLRKTYAKLIADNLVGTQAMNTPSSMIFYVRYRYATNKGATTAGTQIMRQNTAQAYARQNGWALDPYYSSQEVHGESCIITGGTVVTVTLAQRPVLAGSVEIQVFPSAEDADPSCDTAQPCLTVTFDAAGNPQNIIISDCTEFTSTINVNTVTAGATSFNTTTGIAKVTLSAGSFPANAVAKVNYEYNLEGNPLIPELKMSIDSDSVYAATRKLKASWTLEAAQDMEAVYDMDAEQSITDVLGDEMVAEIDREIINDLIIAAAVRARHDFATAAGASVNFTDRNIALMYKILEVANIIHRLTMRGPANWLVTSADISSKLEQLNDFKASDVYAEDTYEVGIVSPGSLQRKLKIFKDPMFPACKILMGHKGKNPFESGYVFCPYIPLLGTPAIMDPNSYTPSKGVMTRYGKKLVEDGSLYYATMQVTSL
jgi:hypothetical protein